MKRKAEGSEFTELTVNLSAVYRINTWLLLLLKEHSPLYGVVLFR